MLVYIRLHNAHLGIYVFMAPGWAEGESLSNLGRAARGANTAGVRAAEFSTLPDGRGLGAAWGWWCNASSRKEGQRAGATRTTLSVKPAFGRLFAFWWLRGRTPKSLVRKCCCLCRGLGHQG